MRRFLRKHENEKQPLFCSIMFPSEVWRRVLEWVSEDTETLQNVSRCSHGLRDVVDGLRPMSHPDRFLWLARHGLLRARHLGRRLLGRARCSKAIREAAIEGGSPESIRLLCGSPRKLPWIHRERLRVCAGLRETDRERRLQHAWTVQEVLYTRNYSALLESPDRTWWRWDQNPYVVNVKSGYIVVEEYGGSRPRERSLQPIKGEYSLPPVIDIDSLHRVWRENKDVAAQVVERFAVAVPCTHIQERAQEFMEWLYTLRQSLRDIWINNSGGPKGNAVIYHGWVAPRKVHVLFQLHDLEPVDERAIHMDLIPWYISLDVAKQFYQHTTIRTSWGATNPQVVEYLHSVGHYNTCHPLYRQLASIVRPDLVERVPQYRLDNSTLERMLAVNPRALRDHPEVWAPTQAWSGCKLHMYHANVRDLRSVQDRETLDLLLADGNYLETECRHCCTGDEGQWAHGNWVVSWAPRCFGYRWLLVQMLKLHKYKVSTLLWEWWKQTREGPDLLPNEHERAALVQAGYIHYEWLFV
jgi:hypothetical protein